MGKRGTVRPPKPIGSACVRSRRRAREITSQYHQITSAIRNVSNRSDLESGEKKQLLQQLNAELREMGGTEAYQQASVLSTQHFNTSKWVLGVLINSGRRPRGTKLRVLEVGAINTYLSDIDWLDVCAIDLHSQHPRIQTKDFFDIEPTGCYDVVVCSMVINCVPEPLMRGEMLARLRMHLAEQQAKAAICFLMLPKLCLEKSMYITKEIFEGMLASCGFNIVQTRETPKVQFYCLERAELRPTTDTAKRRRTWQETFRQDVYTPSDRFARFIAALQHTRGGSESSGILQPPKLPASRKNTNQFGVLLPRNLFSS